MRGARTLSGMSVGNGELTPAAPMPGWFLPAMRLAMWVERLHDSRETRREVRALLQPARRLTRLGRPLRAVHGTVVGQTADPPTEGEAGLTAERAWERVREGGSRALDRAQREAARLYDAAGRLYDRWLEARQEEARILSEFRDGIAEVAHAAAAVPHQAASFLSGGGLVLLALVALALLSSNRSN